MFKAISRYSIILTTIATLGIFCNRARSEEYTFNVYCSFSNPSTGEAIGDRDCEVTQVTSDGGVWSHTTIYWSDDVVTEIEILTVNREPGDRVSSRYGEAEIDGEFAEYETFSDGGIVFEIVESGKIFTYR